MQKESDLEELIGAADLGVALRRIGEGAVVIRTKGEAGTGNIVEAVRHMGAVMDGIRKLVDTPQDELMAIAKEMGAPFELVAEIHKTGKLPVVNFAATDNGSYLYLGGLDNHKSID